MNPVVLSIALLMATALTANAEGFNVYEAVPTTAQDIAAGEATARRLTDRYNSTVENCGSASQPAFLCSGIVLRGTRALAEGQRSYVPNTEAIKVGSSSFNYLRSDSNNIAMTNNYRSGFIFYPVIPEVSPEQRTKIEVLCYFPLDGNSNARLEQGCGMFGNDRASVSCTDQQITTAKQWFDKYERDAQVVAKRCSFNVRDALNQQATKNFYQGLTAKRMVNDKYPKQSHPGSLKLANWRLESTDDAKKLPIEAFFYLGGGDEAASLAQAKRNKAQFFRDSGLTVPVIRLTLPVEPAAGALLGRATFTFRAQDQQ